MPSSTALLLWLFIRSALMPHDPAGLIVPPGDLPSARSAYGWLETTAPQVISDSFDSGGLMVARTARLGVHGTSFTDTTFRINGLDATSTLRPGTPMVLPDTVGAASISVTRLASDASMSAPGPVVDWRAMDGRTRTMIAEGFFMAPRWAIKPSMASAMPVEQLTSLADGSFLIAGALVPGKANAMLSAHWARADRLEGTNPTERRATQLSLVGNLSFTPSDRDDGQALIIVQRATPSAIAGQASPKADAYGTAQFSWRHTQKNAMAYRVTGGYQWSDTTSVATASTSIDSAFDGAVFPNIFRPAGKETVLRLGADVALAPRSAMGMTHRVQAWGSFDRSTMTPTLATTLLVAERVNGVAARAWRVDVPTTAPSWTSSTGALYATDRIGSEHAWVELGVRAESMQSSNGGTAGISWNGVYPHAGFDVFNVASGLGIFGTFNRAGIRLPPMTLAYGDVNAPSARVYRWIDANNNGVVDGAEATGTGNLIARVGPGSANGLTAVDPKLSRPTANLFMGGLRFEKSRFAMSVTAIARRQNELVRAVADGGAAYTIVTQADPNADFTHPSDDQQLQGFNRTTASFGLDHYTLTNPLGLGETSSYTLDLSMQYRGRRARIGFSAAAVKAKGTAANRGYRADENDPGLIGEVPSDPNASSFSKGARPFFDRGYVGKIVGVFTLPAQTTLGLVTRYQDGQPFSRLAIFSNLNQGPEAVVAYAPGRPTRFTYIATTDVRLQKAFVFGSGQLSVIVDGFNVFNIGREVEEYVLTNAAFRSVTSIEPPRTLRIGLRLSF
ncbi:MAG: TonB-dependent receptor [Acidobacteria bacterium]|nr:TonB-dependent receptor [Acidobacteriota bacterium]